LQLTKEVSILSSGAPLASLQVTKGQVGLLNALGLVIQL
jgi:hypothetical protein